jgi:hypothetical protein
METCVVLAPNCISNPTVTELIGLMSNPLGAIRTSSPSVSQEYLRGGRAARSWGFSKHDVVRRLARKDCGDAVEGELCSIPLRSQ